jgi:endonuclease III related protein
VSLRERGRGGPGEVYRRLVAAHGHQGWWPGRDALEICLGAILVQNTAWAGAERALRRLEAAGLLRWEKLCVLSAAEIAPYLRAAGTFNVKARRVRAFLDFVQRELAGDLTALARMEPAELRAMLLGVSGVGEETADSIALYAGGHPVFVVDAYTRRILGRLGFMRGDEGYAEVQRFFTRRLPADAALFNDFHAQLVRLAKDICRPRPRCAACPLLDMCARGRREGVPSC